MPKNGDAVISCLAIHPKTKNLIITYSNHHFVECCTKTGKYTKLTNILMENLHILPENWLKKTHVTKGIVFPQAHLSGLMSKKSDTILFYDEEYIAVLDRHFVMNDIEKMVSVSPTKKQAKNNDQKSNKTKIQSFPNILRLSKRYEHLAFLGTLIPENNDDLTAPIVAVEVKPQVFESQLPPSMRQKKFGAM